MSLQAGTNGDTSVNMKGGGICVHSPQLELPVKDPKVMVVNLQIKRSGLTSARKSLDGLRSESGKPIIIMPRHIRLARASYKTTSDADVPSERFDNCEVVGGKKRTRNSRCDFWTRVDSGEIKVQQTMDEWRKSMPPLKGSRIDTNIPNFAISTTSMADYSYKSTAFGDVYYSPRFNDNKYTYRFVILTRGVRNEAYRILKSCGRYFLSESQIIHQLGIDLSPGWEHFMVFRNKLDELILRRPLNS